jgi:hypothetical protein
MKRNGAGKVVWLDAAGVGSSKEFVHRSSFFFGRIIIPLFHMYEDAAVADEPIEKSLRQPGSRRKVRWNHREHTC